MEYYPWQQFSVVMQQKERRGVGRRRRGGSFLYITAFIVPLFTITGKLTGLSYLQWKAKVRVGAAGVPERKSSLRSLGKR